MCPIALLVERMYSTVTAKCASSDSVAFYISSQHFHYGACEPSAPSGATGHLVRHTGHI
jgi:hypothetical protein